MVLDVHECVQSRTFFAHPPRQLGGSAGPPQQHAPPPQETTTTAIATLPRASSTAHSRDVSPKWYSTPLSCPKAYFLCAPTQVVGWVGLCATAPRPVSSEHDHSCLGGVAMSEFHCTQPRRHLYGTRRPCVRPKAHFRCAPTQVNDGWNGPSATTASPVSSGSDYECVSDAATREPPPA